MKQQVNYQINIRGTKAELNEFEKLLTKRRITTEDLIEWDDVNEEDNAPSGILTWSKFKWLKHAALPITRKELIK